VFAVQHRISRSLITVSFVALLISGLMLAFAVVARAQSDDGVGVTGASPDQSDSPDIIGGREAEPGAWPWQVGLVKQFADNTYDGQFCGGTLVAPNWVLTAAHCTDVVNEEFLTVLVGAHRLSDSGRIVHPDLVIVHPAWDPYTLENDLALLRLSQAVTETPISLYHLAEGSDEMSFLRATVTGWGRTETGMYPDALREVAIPLVAHDVCNAAMYGVITNEMICAGYPKLVKGACYGDSGGPLMVQDSTGQWLQIGIVSFGPSGCISFSRYDVFTRVSSFADWAETCMANPDRLECNGSDIYEPDDSAAAAKPFGPFGEYQVYSFHVSGDQDWISFEAVAGNEYVIETAESLTSTVTVDTVVWLYGPDGHTPITYHDGDPASGSLGSAVSRPDSSIAWQAEKSGVYYLSVENIGGGYWGANYGPNARYQLTISEYAHQHYLPSAQKSDLFLPLPPTPFPPPAEAVPVTTPVVIITPAPFPTPALVPTPVVTPTPTAGAVTSAD